MFQSFPWSHWQRACRPVGRARVGPDCPLFSQPPEGDLGWGGLPAMQSCPPTPVTRGVTFWFGFCLSFSLLVCVSFSLLLGSLSSSLLSMPSPLATTLPPHRLSRTHLCALTPLCWFLCSLLPLSLAAAASERAEHCCRAVCEAGASLLSYRTGLDVALGLLLTVYFSLCCTG